MSAEPTTARRIGPDLDSPGEADYFSVYEESTMTRRDQTLGRRVATARPTPGGCAFERC